MEGEGRQADWETIDAEQHTSMLVATTVEACWASAGALLACSQAQERGEETYKSSPVLCQCAPPASAASGSSQAVQQARVHL
jgi:hypothetical protein